MKTLNCFNSQVSYKMFTSEEKDSGRLRDDEVKNNN